MSYKPDAEDYVAKANIARAAFEKTVIQLVKHYAGEGYIEDPSLLIARVLDVYEHHEADKVNILREQCDQPYQGFQGSWTQLKRADSWLS